MATIKSFTDISQSKTLGKILPLESADSYYSWHDERYYIVNKSCPYPYSLKEKIPAWSLAALLNILHSQTKNIPSLSGGGYKDGKYTLDWCLDYEFDDGDYQKTFADNPVDACVAMIERLNELKML